MIFLKGIEKGFDKEKISKRFFCDAGSMVKVVQDPCKVMRGNPNSNVQVFSHIHMCV